MNNNDPQSPADVREDSATTLITRRKLLQGMGCLIAAAALPPSRAEADVASKEGSAAPAPAGSVMAKLSAYMGEAASRELPPEVAEAAKHHILDTISAMVSGVVLPPGKAALNFARVYGGGTAVTIVGTRETAGPIEGALVNGMLAHSDETDDSHAPGRCHPGCGIVAAALSAGEQFGIDGTRLVRAVTLGYDVGTRMPMTLGEGYTMMLNRRSSHQVANTFGACAASACAAGLTARQMRWVLDYAAQQASGTTAWQHDTQHIEKSLCFAGFPARNGVSTALLISGGATGVDDIFSGPDSYFQAYSPKCNPAGMIDRLGERYEVTRTNIKKWTVGSPIQAPLDALGNLRKRRPFEADQVTKVIVRVATSEAKIVDNREMPDICMQHMVAVMLLDKTASFKAAHDKSRMEDPEILRQRAKVQMIADEGLEKLYPARPCVVEVTFTDGSTLTERIDAVRGTAENPMTREEVAAKARELMEPSLGADRCLRLIDSILALESVQDIRTLRPLLQPA